MFSVDFLQIIFWMCFGKYDLVPRENFGSNRRIKNHYKKQKVKIKDLQRRLNHNSQNSFNLPSRDGYKIPSPKNLMKNQIKT